MDVTPQVINEVEFHQKMRGYDPDEVDDFLERVAVAVGQLSDRLHEAETRAATADRRAIELERKVRELAERPPEPAEPAAPAAPAVDDETETIRRTLVLAQRTADAAVKEAQEDAQRTLAGAQAQADALLNDAQTTSRRLVSDAEFEARKASEETRQRMIDEIVLLEETREALKADQGILERHLEEQRLRLRSSIGDLQRLLDDPVRLRASNPPELSNATRPAFIEDTPTAESENNEDIEPAEPAASADADVSDADDDGVIDLDAAANADAHPSEDGVERSTTGGVRFTPADENAPASAPSRMRTAIASDDDGDTDAWTRFVREEMLDRPTAAVSTVPGAEDDYLTQLRNSMLQGAATGPADAGDRPSRNRFGRRR